MTISTERLQEMLAACEDYIANHVADFDDNPHADPVGEFNPYTIRSILTELLAMREAVKPADDPETVLHALQIASIAAPYYGISGQLFRHRPYIPDGYRDAEFRDYGLARAVRILCDNAKAIAATLTKAHSE